MAFVRPTGFEIPDGKWNNGAQAIDVEGDPPVTSASSDEMTPNSDTEYFHVTRIPTYTSQVKFYALSNNYHCSVRLDYYDGAWHSIVSWKIVAEGWDTVNIPDGPKTITKVRFQGRNEDDEEEETLYIYDVWWNEQPPPPLGNPWWYYLRNKMRRAG